MTKRTLLVLAPTVLGALIAGVYVLGIFAEVPDAPMPEAPTPVIEEPAEGIPSPSATPVLATHETVQDPVRVLEAPQTATLIVEGTTLPIASPEGTSIEDAMEGLKASGALSYEVRSFAGLGQMVEEIQGKANTSDYYWILHVNGKKSATGISATRIRSGDVIEWKYEKKY